MASRYRTTTNEAALPGHAAMTSTLSGMIEVTLNDRLGKKVRIACNSTDTVRDLKLMAAALTGTRAEKLRLQKWHTVLKDHITLADYEVSDGSNLELYYS